MATKGIPLNPVYMAFSTSSGNYVTGDSGNHTIKYLLDGAEATPTNSPAEIDATNLPGAYAIALTTAEATHNLIFVGGKSSNPNNVILVPAQIGMDNIPIFLPGAPGGLLIAGSNSATTGFSGLSVTGTTVLTGLVTAVAGISGAQGSVNVTSWNGGIVGPLGSPGNPLIAGSNSAVTAFSGFAVTGLTAFQSGFTIQGTTLHSGIVLANAGFSGLVSSVNVTAYVGTNIAAPATAGIPDVNIKNISNSTTVGTAGFVGIDWAQVANKTTVNALTGTSIGSGGNIAPGGISFVSFQPGSIAASTFSGAAITSVTIDSTYANSLADTFLNRANAVETGVTPVQALRYSAAAQVGVTAGALNSNFSIFAMGNSGTLRIHALTDQSGNRQTIVLS